MRLSQHSTLVPPTARASLVRASSTPEDHAIALWREPTDPLVWMATRQDRDGVTSVVSFDAHAEWKFPLIQAMPAGATLIVDARCYWSESGPQKNAVVVDDVGDVSLEGTIGDGIQELLTNSPPHGPTASTART
jgi:hypothetical protein